MFTVSFVCESSVFDRYEDLARALLGSFHARRLSPQLVAETGADPETNAWETYIFGPINEVQSGHEDESTQASPKSSSSSCRLIRPSEWQRHEVPNPRVIRFCCARGEKTLKIINYFIVEWALTF